MKVISLLLLLIGPVLFARHTARGADPPAKPEANAPAASAIDPIQTPARADADAESDKPEPRKKGALPTMDVVKVRGGQKTLAIRFRWSLFPNSSVEVRLKPDSDKGKASPSPVYFSEQLKGSVREELYKCLDHVGEGGYVHSFTKEGLVYKMIGGRNPLGKQGAHVEVQPEAANKTADKNPAAAYLQLDAWSVDAETLSLDLDREEFAQPGRLYVWFFRGGDIVWDEQIHWPGYK